MKTIHSLLLLAGVSFFFSSIHSSNAANYTVVMGPGFNLVFTPGSLAVGQGDTVTWTNGSSTTHTSTSGTVPGGSQAPDGLWNSPFLNPNGTFSVDFSNFATNTYPYYCAIHGAAMVGALTVTNDVPQPQAALTNQVLAGSQFQFTVNGLIGQKYVVQSSPDLITWSAISTNLAISTTFMATDPSAGGFPIGFYRVLELH